MLKAKVWLIAKFVLRFCFFHHDDVLDSDAEGTVFIVARLIGNHVSGCQRDFGVLDSGSDADWAFVDVEV